MPPLVSAIIPALNAEEFVADAIESILAQTYAEFEVIVVDDGSTDGTGRIVRSFAPRVELLQQAHQGISAARNLAISRARGQFLAFLDADDIAMPERFALGLGAFESQDELDLVFGHIKEFQGSGKSAGALIAAVADAASRPGAIPSACMMRKHTFMQVGLFDPGRKHAEFFEWYLRARELGVRERMLDAVVALRRIHGGNIGLREAANVSVYARLLRSSLRRRRGKKRPDDPSGDK